MAKNNKIQSLDKKDRVGGGKILTALIIFLIVLIWLAILALLIKFDVGNLGSEVLRPVLKDIPVVNRILPDVSEEQEAYENAYPYKNLGEAVEYIKKLEEQVDKYREENSDYAIRQAEMQKEIDSLRHYEEEQDEFAKLREAFDREVVFNEKAPTTDEYLKWYASMYPNNAAKIYNELLERKLVEDSLKKYADYLASMEPGEAADILSEYPSDIDMICRLLDCMKKVQVSDILREMEPLFAARILNRMIELGMEPLE
jgi:flagellar motility protein MotE (MotC chaperone)